MVYHLPYWGIGLYKPFFASNPGLGNPFSIYLFRGNTLAQFTDNLGLVLELDLGVSMNWKYYDPVHRPENRAIGSPNNVHIGSRLYLEYALFKNLDLKLGADLTHFSNGNARMPNLGINMGALSFSAAYKFNPLNKGFLLRNMHFNPPVIPRHVEHDAQFVFSSRQTKFDTKNTNLPSPYVDKDFMVLGVIYSPMMAKGCKYKWGPSIQFIYDESSNAKAWRDSNQLYDCVVLAKFPDRLSLGLALRGEISMPIVSVFAMVGYNVYHKHHFDRPLFQTAGVKIYLKDNFFASFSISAMEFKVAQYLYWSFGYTFSSVPRQKYTL